MRWQYVWIYLGLFVLIGYLAWLRAKAKRKPIEREYEYSKKQEEGFTVEKRRWFTVILFCLLPLTGCGAEQVDEGYRGIETRFGKIQGEPLPPGLHFYNPITSDIFEMDVRERKVEVQTDAFTRDTQTVRITYALTLYPDPAQIHHLYSQFGMEWDSKIVPQVTLGSIKDTVGQYIADEIVQNREKAKSAAEQVVKNSLKARGVVATRLDFVNLDFDDAYEKAVEAKVVAIQRAAEAKNHTVQVDEEAKQKVTAAKADAEAMRIKSQALSQNKGLVQYEAIQKWNGKLPDYMFGSTVPMINLDSIKKE